jgi:hypothetical protein
MREMLPEKMRQPVYRKIRQLRETGFTSMAPLFEKS